MDSKSTIKKSNSIYRVMTAAVADKLSDAEIHEAFEQLHEKMKTPDPDNPNLWIVHVRNHKLWGILDHGAGPSQKDLLTLLFPEDY